MSTQVDSCFIKDPDFNPGEAAVTVALELDPELEQIARAKAAAQGIPLEEYLPLVITEFLWQQQWEELPEEESLGRLTMLAAEPVLSRVWDTPEEDEAWKHLEGL